MGSGRSWARWGRCSSRGDRDRHERYGACRRPIGWPEPPAVPGTTASVGPLALAPVRRWRVRGQVSAWGRWAARTRAPPSRAGQGGGRARSAMRLGESLVLAQAERRALDVYAVLASKRNGFGIASTCT